MADTQGDSKNEAKNESFSGGLNRRTFLGALGAAAVAGAFLETGGRVIADDETYWFYDSWGNVVAVDPEVIAAGIYPPPMPAGVSPSTPGGPLTPSEELDFTFVTGGYAQPNILMIMVDQLRFPRWLTQTQQNTFAASIMPNVYGSAGLIKKAVSFENFFVAANDCTPSRSSFLTGLYPQQTCMFVTENRSTAPSLQPWNGGSGFPTIGDVLSQSLNINADGSGGLSIPYDTAWIGKWHVSDENVSSTGAVGPSAYGFSSLYNIPISNGASSPYPNTYSSPNGYQNEGAGGQELNTATFVFPYNTLATPADPIDVKDLGLNIHPTGAPDYRLSDAAIYRAFKEYWLPSPPNYPWFLGLSFVNPHDIQYFPWAFGLATTANGQACGSGDDFNCAVTPSFAGFYPPSVLGWVDRYDNSNPITFNGLPYTLYNASGTLTTGAPPSGWNNTDNPQSHLYNVGGVPGGKPGLQAFFQNGLNSSDGGINTAEGWCIFLNYYYWLQSFVDTLIGQVFFELHSAGLTSKPTAVIFTSDHGDYGGSHNLHTKGGALYDEAHNVPLLFEYPLQANSIVRSYLCSSVDFLPFIYSIALGNESWRYASTDIVNYLQGRESLFDVVFNTNAATYRRQVLVPNSAGGINTMPYVLFSTDEYNYAAQWNNTSVPQPSHAVAIRTLDANYRFLGSDNTMNFFGGGKLGMYTYWPNAMSYPNTAAGLTQFEFYDYYLNPGEVGNDAFNSGNWNTATAGAYLTAYNNIMAAELYNIYPQIAVAHNTGFDAYMNYMNFTGYTFQAYPPNTIPPP